MRRRRLDTIVLTGAALALLIGAGLSLGAGGNEGTPTLKSLAARVLALEQRVNSLERRLAVVEGAGRVVGKGQREMIEITSPASGATVGKDVVVEGIVRMDDLGGRVPVVGVHPLMTTTIWVQPLPTKIEKTEEGFFWRSRAYVGTANLGIGEKYELLAMLMKRGQVKEGDQLDHLPKEGVVSRAVVVTRR